MENLASMLAKFHKKALIMEKIALMIQESR